MYSVKKFASIYRKSRPSRAQLKLPFKNSQPKSGVAAGYNKDEILILKKKAENNLTTLH